MTLSRAGSVKRLVNCGNVYTVKSAVSSPAAPIDHQALVMLRATLSGYLGGGGGGGGQFSVDYSPALSCAKLNGFSEFFSCIYQTFTTVF